MWLPVEYKLWLSESLCFVTQIHIQSSEPKAIVMVNSKNWSLAPILFFDSDGKLPIEPTLGKESERKEQVFNKVLGLLKPEFTYWLKYDWIGKKCPPSFPYPLCIDKEYSVACRLQLDKQ